MADIPARHSAYAQPEETTSSVINNPSNADPVSSTAASNTHTLPIRSKDNDHPANGNNPRPSSYKPPAVATEDPALDSNNKDDDDDNDASDQEAEYGEITNLPPPTPIKKKKKRKPKKSASKRGLGKPTGFEDFFADTPLTPDEHAEEVELYDRDLHFIDRILTAIARFERTRKMTNERRDVLYKYLSYGGVECGPNMLKGGQDTSDMAKSTMISILTNASLTEEKRNLSTETSIYAVDFLGCMKSFLSRRAAYFYGFEKRESVELVTTTLERFMDYLLQHDVCPEYGVEVLATRNFCRTATQELWNTAEATRRLPGDFNMACSTLFGGYYAKNYDGETWWGPEHTTDNVFVGLKPEEASQILHFGVAGAATEDVFAFYLQGVNGSKTLEVVSVKENAGFEITSIEPPTAECKEIYISNSKNFRPVGRVYAIPWTNPDAPPEDLTPAERAELASKARTKQADDGDNNEIQEDSKEEYVFFIESILQSYLKVGTKVEATIRTMNCGIMFFDEVTNLYPTFDTYLPNEAMLGWKKPRAVKGAFDFVEEDEEDGAAEEGDSAGEDNEGNVEVRGKGAE